MQRSPPTRVRSGLSQAAIVLLFLLPARPGLGQPAATAGPLTLEAIKIEPAVPAADTLCRLRVMVRNAGDANASQLRFTVRLNGQALRVYDSQLYYQALPPGETTEVRLFNFWTTETARPRPPDGKLTVEVVLEEARFMNIERQGDTETWTPQGEVPGLPSRAEVVLQLP